jgi:hypothetical protein
MIAAVALRLLYPIFSRPSVLERLLGRDATVAHRHKPVRIGFDFLHVAVDGHTRLAYAEAHNDERDATAAGFLRRACVWFA